MWAEGSGVGPASADYAALGGGGSLNGAGSSHVVLAGGAPSPRRWLMLGLLCGMSLVSQVGVVTGVGEAPLRGRAPRAAARLQRR